MDADDNPNKFQPKSLALKVSIFIVVLVVGAAIFQAIEKEDAPVDPGAQNRAEIVRNMTLKYNISGQDFDKLLAVIKDGLEQEELASKPQWTFSNSVFLTFSIMTTIGKYLKRFFHLFLYSLNCFSSTMCERKIV